MDFVLIFAISWCGLFLLVLLVNLATKHRKAAKSVFLRLFTFLLIRNIVRRHKLIGPITILSLAIHISYVALHVFCLTFRIRSSQEFVLRAGNMALLNLFPFGLNFSLKLWLDSLGLPLQIGLSIHRASGWMCCVLVLCHLVAVIMTSHSPLVFDDLYITLVLYPDRFKVVM